MSKVIQFKREDRIEYDSCNKYWLSPVDIDNDIDVIHCVLLFDVEENFYRLNIYTGADG